ncbi:DNA-binding protein, putative [Shewanella piezotolerans WP3]|uniref:DNA-binding protein, putative n=1 Tax=Shewanella piezotolerans (strain WP3 / JCM 13877) TaxID=225849 RepID=B8CKR0_SHEPW|nr:RodZ domain-containing protein [Shewanella piezotolerans]ACJ28236.1 DNA-binding protein, putative [Shewanella piezotolerans WP3]
MKNEQNDLPNIDTESLVDEPTLTLGVLLKKARENKGASVEDIAAQLHLRPAIIREIEADNLLEIGAATYVRGYVKNYARAVQADPFEVQTCLDKQLLNDEQPSMQSFSRKTTHQARDGRLMALTYIIVFVLLALMVLWWFQKSSMETTVDYSQPTVEEVAASAEEAMYDESLINSEAALAAQSNNIPLDERIVETIGDDVADNNSTEQYIASNQDVTSEEQPELQVAEASSQVSAAQLLASMVDSQDNDTSDAVTSALMLTLSGDCWIKVTDANGNTLIDGLKKSGRDINVTGAEPFAVILGAPQVVNIQLNGTQVSLDQYPSGKVARFSLPLAGQ